MRIYFHVRSLFVAMVLIMTAGNLPAATIEVPGGQPTIQGAIDAAAPGDTILITDSGTYAENLLITEQVTIAAEAGQNPTLTNPGELGAGDGFGADTPAMIVFGVGSTGAQFGSVDGGRINIHLNTNHPDLAGGTPDTRIYVVGIDTEIEEVTLENFFYTRDPFQAPGENYRVHFIRDDSQPEDPRTVNVNWAELDANEGNGPDGLFRVAFNSQAVYNLNQVYIHGMGTEGNFALYSRMGMVFRLDSCYIDGSEISTGVVRLFTGGGNADIENSVIIGGDGPTIFRSTGPSSVTLKNSVIINAQGQTVYGTSDDEEWDYVDADHCDFVVLDVAAGTDPIFSVEEPTTKSISITNSNIVGIGNSTENAVEIVVGAGDVVTLSHNNVHAPGWAGLYSASAAPLVANSLSLDPNYTDPSIGDVTYTNATLKTADSTGGAIGTDADLSDVVPQPPPPPNAARHWTLF